MTDTKKAVKLIRVSNGLYRTTGGWTIMHMPFGGAGESWEEAKANPWLVKIPHLFLADTYQNRRFRTLKDVRAFINEGR